MENFITIIISFYLGKYSDKLIIYLNNLVKKSFTKKKYNDFYECTFKEKDFEEGGK